MSGSSSASMYHSATGVQSPHCIHVVGIGRTGAAYVEALLRTGEIEDQLLDPRATFAALAWNPTLTNQPRIALQQFG